MNKGVLVLAFVVLVGATNPGSGQVSRRDCFPLERASEHLRVRAEVMLLETADSPALYTLITGLKPVTSNFLASLGPRGALVVPREAMKAGSNELRQVDELRSIVSMFTCGDDIRAAVVNDMATNAGAGRTSVEPFLFHMPAVRRVIESQAAGAAAFGVTPHTSAETVLFTLQGLFGSQPQDPQKRLSWEREHARLIGHYDRITGFLYGYSASAIEAFIAMRQNVIATGVRPSRGDAKDPGFMRIPSYRGDDFYYVPAVKGQPKDDDVAIRTAAGKILAEYRKRRERYIGPGKAGIAALLRDWFCTAAGCSASNATVAAPAR